MYYDLGSRKNGEETFVVINTTGEPLSTTQNLKPLVCNASINKNYEGNEQKVGAEAVSMDWEAMETWFWQHRAAPNDTADAGFNEFLRWVTMIEADKDDMKRVLSSGMYRFPIERIPFQTIMEYWYKAQFLFEQWQYHNKLEAAWLSPKSNNDLKGLKGNSQIDCFIILPLLAYCRKWNVSDANDRNLYRLYQFLYNQKRIENIKKDVNNMICDAIQIAIGCRDIVDVLQLDMRSPLLSKEEHRKLEILVAQPDNRADIEEAFWQAQEHRIWHGQILAMMEWADTDGLFSLGSFNAYKEIFSKTFDGECGANIDEVRRALLTAGLTEYPRIFRGYTVYSFGWEWSDWFTLIYDNKQPFKIFFDKLLNGETCKNMIANYPAEQPWSEFVHNEELLRYCKEKNLQYYHNTWFLMKKMRWNGDHANIHAYKYWLKRKSQPFGDWEIAFWANGDTCVYLNAKDKTAPYVSIDIIWNQGADHSKIEFDLFMKPTNKPNIADTTKSCLQPVAQQLGFEWSNNRYRKYIKSEGAEEKDFTMVDTEVKKILDQLQCSC